jgi:predicted enzyme related to lactoylglutathione lyase
VRPYHLHLVASDVAAAASFYTTYFGFRRVFPDSPEVFLQDESGFLLAIGTPEGPAVPPQTEFHFGFQATDANEARALLERMTANGVRIAVPWTEFPHGTVKFHCVDPSGYGVEVRWDPPR